MENFKYHPDRIKHVPGQEGPITDPEKAQIMAEMEDTYHELGDMYDEYLTRPEIFLEQYPAVNPRVERYMELEEKDDEFDAYEQQERRKNEEAGKVIFSISFGGAPETPAPQSPRHEMAILSSDPEVAKYIEDPEAYLAEHPTTSDDIAQFGDMRQKGIGSDYVRRIGEWAAEVKGAMEDYEAAVYGKPTKELKSDRLRAWKDLSLGVIEAMIAAKDLGDSEKTGHVDIKQDPDFYNAQTKLQLALAIKNASRDQLKHRKPGPNYDYPAHEKALEAFIPKIKTFAERQVSEITEPELDALIEEVHGIELPGRGTAEIYGHLLDLRQMLFRPDDFSPRLTEYPPETVMSDLRETLGMHQKEAA
jgi:hypothetical protein